jgi:transcription termination factor 2
MTGTPIHNSINDFYALVKFLNFEPLSEFGLWKYLFATMLTKTVKPTKDNEMREKRCNHWVFLLSKFLILRRTKADKIAGTERRIVDLPDKNIQEIRIKLNPEEKAIYSKIFHEAKNEANKFLTTQKQREFGVTGSQGSNLSRIFVMILRLRQACCHMSLLSECLDRDELKTMRLETEGVEGLMQSLNINDTIGTETDISLLQPASNSTISQEDVDLTKCLKKKYMSSKLESLIDMIEHFSEEFPDDKMIVVSQWTSMLEVVGKNLENRDIEFCEVKGDIKLNIRNDIVEDFNKPDNKRIRVMLLSLTAGGVGLNLVGANRMFLLDIHWNPALEQQCADRIYRVGQTKEVTIYKFLCENTIEQRILEVQGNKLTMADKVCNAQASNGTTSLKNGKLTSSDLKLLFQDFEDE